MDFPLVPIAIVLPLEPFFAMRTLVFMITMLRVYVLGEVFGKSEGPNALCASVLMGFGGEMFSACESVQVP
jgi:hypothetical protein